MLLSSCSPLCSPPQSIPLNYNHLFQSISLFVHILLPSLEEHLSTTDRRPSFNITRILSRPIRELDSLHRPFLKVHCCIIELIHPSGRILCKCNLFSTSTKSVR